MTTATLDPASGNQTGVWIVLALLAVLAICACLYQHERRSDRHGRTLTAHDRQLGLLDGRIEGLAVWLGVELNDPVDDSPQALEAVGRLLAEPHLRGLTRSAEDLSDLLPGRATGLGVPRLSDDLIPQRGMEGLQGVQGVQLPSDVSEVVGQSVEDRGTQLVADRFVIPVGDNEVAEDVTEPPEGFPGAVITGRVVFEGESGDCHSVKDGLTSSPCQDEFDADPEPTTDEFPAQPGLPTEPMAVVDPTPTVQARRDAAWDQRRPSPVPRTDSDEAKARKAAWVESELAKIRARIDAAQQNQFATEEAS